MKKRFEFTTSNLFGPYITIGLHKDWELCISIWNKRVDRKIELGKQEYYDAISYYINLYYVQVNIDNCWV